MAAKRADASKLLLCSLQRLLRVNRLRAFSRQAARFERGQRGVKNSFRRAKLPQQFARKSRPQTWR